jgi:hypothetical protein
MLIEVGLGGIILQKLHHCFQLTSTISALVLVATEEVRLIDTCTHPNVHLRISSCAAAPANSSVVSNRLNLHWPVSSPTVHTVATKPRVVTDGQKCCIK